MRLDEPAWATTEEAFARWAEARCVDENDETYEVYTRWLEDDSWEPEPDDGEPYFGDEPLIGEPF